MSERGENMKKIKLFCLPYAGGSAMIYMKYRPYLDPGIELYPVELAGRGKRYNEPFYYDFNQAVNDVFEIILNRIEPSDQYAIFGHSMGCWIAEEVVMKLMTKKNIPLPIHVFLSGNKPIHNRYLEPVLHHLSDEEFLDELKHMGGTPPEFFMNKELVNLFLPIIRNDFRIIEEFEYKGLEQPFQSNLSVLSGRSDKYTINELIEWENYCTMEFEIVEFEGDHFFVLSHIKEVAELINDRIGKHQLVRI